MSAATAIKKLTPECVNMASGLSMSGIAVVVLSLISVALMAWVIMTFRKATVDNTTKSHSLDDKKAGTLRMSVYGAIGTSLLATLVGAWNIMITGKLKTCIS